MNEIRVKLKYDLTKYDTRCVVGSLGKHTPGQSFSIWARTQDRFWGIEFDNGAKLDVLTSSLEIVK